MSLWVRLLPSHLGRWPFIDSYIIYVHRDFPRCCFPTSYELYGLSFVEFNNQLSLKHPLHYHFVARVTPMALLNDPPGLCVGELSEVVFSTVSEPCVVSMVGLVWRSDRDPDLGMIDVGQHSNLIPRSPAKNSLLKSISFFNNGKKNTRSRPSGLAAISSHWPLHLFNSHNVIFNVRGKMVFHLFLH